MTNSYTPTLLQYVGDHPTAVRFKFVANSKQLKVITGSVPGIGKHHSSAVPHGELVPLRSEVEQSKPIP